MRIAMLVLIGVLAPSAMGLAAASASNSASASAPSSASNDDAKPTTSCRRLPAGKRLVKLNLKPSTDVGDLLAWISTVTCKQFVLPATIAAGKTVTIVSPQLVTPEEAYRLFLDALDAVGLTVYPAGRYLRVIEVDKAKASPIPVVPPVEATK
jgi:general secretion pathway protein D